MEVEFETKNVFVMERRDYFLTYPKCDLTIDDVLLEMHEFEFEYIIVCKEKHKDGTDHIHVYVLLKKAKKIHERTFDISGYHPNIGKPKNKFACINYVKKDGNYKDLGDAPQEKTSKRKRDGPSGEDIKEKAMILEYTDFLVWVANEDLNVHLCKEIYNSLKLDEEEFTIREEYEIPAGASVDDKLLAIDLEEVKSKRKCLVLTGRSGSGKTQVALKLAPKPCLLVSHTDDLKKLRKWHKSIVFDDMKFTHYPSQSRIHLVDYLSPRARSINVKYGSCSILPSQYRIFTCNAHPLIQETVQKSTALGVEFGFKFGDTPEERAAIERRIERIHI